MVRLGIVGCGRLAERGYLPALRDVAGVRLAAVADPDPRRRTLLADMASTLLGQPVAAHDGIGGLLAGEQVDAVLIASPARSHVADARAAAAAGVTALVEKPPAPDLAGVVELAGLAPRPWLGFNRRFDPGAWAVRDAVPVGGEVDLLLRVHYRRPSWGAHTVRDDALLDLGPHLLDWARWLTGSDIVDVACPELTAERAVLELTLGRGQARLEAATDRLHEELVEVRDGSGRIVARHRIGGLVAGVRARILGRGPDTLVTSLRHELAALAAAIRTSPATPDPAPLSAAGTPTPATGKPTTTGTPTPAGMPTAGGRPATGTVEGATTSAVAGASTPAGVPATGDRPATVGPGSSTDLGISTSAATGAGTPIAGGRPAGAGAGTFADLGTVADGVAVMAAVEAARASAAAGGRRVDIPIEEHR